MELAGVLIAVLLLIFLIYKRLSLIPATLICVAVLALTNGFSYMDLFINHYGVSLAGFVGKYFLVFVTNALFGKVMEETLLASVFSKMIGKLFGDKNAVFGAMLANCDPFLWRRQCICYCIYRISHFSCNISQGRSSGKIYSSLHYEQLLYICPFAASWRSPVKQYYSCTVFGHNTGCSCRDRSALLCCGYGIYIRIFFLGI